MTEENNKELTSSHSIDEEEMIPKSKINEYVKSQMAVMLNDEAERKRLETESRRMMEDSAREKFVDLMKQSPEPWVELVSLRVDSQGRIKTEVDWNDAFIQKLKDEKYEGITEEELIQKWLLLVMANTTEEITQ